MVVNSILSTGIEGVRNGVETAQNAAQDIANLNTNTAPTQNTEAQNTSDDQSNGLGELTQAIVDLKVGEHQVKASSAVIQTADEILGTLINTKA